MLLIKLMYGLSSIIYVVSAFLAVSRLSELVPLDAAGPHAQVVGLPLHTVPRRVLCTTQYRGLWDCSDLRPD